MKDLVEIMEDCGAKPDKFTYATLMHAYARQGDAENCQRLLQEMLKRKVNALHPQRSLL
jgi:pentatricopeptide repeat protein